MISEDARKQADETFDRLAAALAAGGWTPSCNPGQGHRHNWELLWGATVDRSIAGVRVIVNSGYGASLDASKIQVGRWGRGRPSWEGRSVEEAIEQALALSSTLVQEKADE